MKYDIINKHIFLYFEEYFDEIKYKPENILSLQICLCNKIKIIPNNLINLKYLFLQDNQNIKYIPNLSNLENLYIENCKNIKELPNNLSNLKKLVLINTNIKEIPNTYINLKILKIKNSPLITSISNNFINLEQLTLINNNQNIIIPNTFKKLNYVETDILRIYNNLNIKKFIIK